MNLNSWGTEGAELKKAGALLLVFWLLTTSFAEQKRYTVGPVVNRFESLGKGLLKDDIGYGLRFGFNYDEHIAGEFSYDYMSNFILEDIPGTSITNGHRVMANFLYNVKDDEGFIPYMIFGLGVEKFDNSKGSLRSGAIGSFGFGAHFLIIEPFSLRFEVKDIVRLSDIGHTFSWTFGLEYSFGKMEKYSSEYFSHFSSYSTSKGMEHVEEPVEKSSVVPSSQRIIKTVYMQNHIEARNRKIEYERRETKKIDHRPDFTPAVLISSAVAPKIVSKQPSVKLKEPKRAKKGEEKRYVSKKIVSAEVKRVEPVKEIIIAPTEPQKMVLKHDNISTSTTVLNKELKSIVSIKSNKSTEAVPIEKSESVENIDIQNMKGVKSSTLTIPKKIAESARLEPVSKKSGTVTVSDAKKAVRARKDSFFDDSCNQDSDRDGIKDCNDLCKKSPFGWSVDSNGCEVGVTMLVNFEFNSARLDSRGRERIGMFASYMEKRPNTNVILEGHTDSIGSETYNIKLSKKRALKVKKALEDLGVKRERIKIEYFGESRPIATNKTKEGRAKNRRVDALFIRLK